MGFSETSILTLLLTAASQTLADATDFVSRIGAKLKRILDSLTAIPVPDWLLSYSSANFKLLADRCGLCAWATIFVAVTAFTIIVWRFARGHQFVLASEKPKEATAGRAFVGFIWLIALVVGSLVAGFKGLIPLVGDTVFVALAQIVCVEWYAWWVLPIWLGKSIEIAVVAILWWLAWLITNAIPNELRWQTLVVTSSATIISLFYMFLAPHLRRLIIVNILGPFILTAFLLPQEYRPGVSSVALWVSLGLLFAWLSPLAGAFWLRLPEPVANSVPPLWFMAMAILAWFGVPMITE